MTVPHTPATRREPSPLTRAASGVAALLLALSWLLLSPAPASSQEQEVVRPRASLESPTADDPVIAPTQLVIAVDRNLSTDPVTAYSRLRRLDGEKVARKDVIIRYDKGEVTQESSQTVRFRGRLNPYNIGWFENGGAIANGNYRIDVAALPGKAAPDAKPAESDWSPHPVTFDAPPPPPTNVRSGAEGFAVTVAWDPVAVPDLVGYRVERRDGDADRWRVVNKDVKPNRTRASHKVPDYGTYRFRVTAIRSSARQGETLTALSAPSKPLLISKAAAQQRPARTPQEQEQRRSTLSPSSGGSSGSGSGSSSVSSPQHSSAPSGPMNPSLSSSSDGADGDPEPFSAPANPNTTFDGPLQYDFDPSREVTERVPVDIARGAAEESGGGTLEVLSRTLDQQRVLQPLAGGLVLLLSAAHVIRFLHE